MIGQCDGCRKCCAVCPAGIDIPAVLSGLENSAKAHKHYGGQPIDCIECGACSALCPQKLAVKEMIREIAMEQVCCGCDDKVAL